MAPAGLPGLRPAGRHPGGRSRAAAEEWWPCLRELTSRRGDAEGTQRGLRPLRAGVEGRGRATWAHAARAPPAACRRVGVASRIPSPHSGRGCPCPESRRMQTSAADQAAFSGSVPVAERSLHPSERRAGCTKRTSGDGVWATPPHQWTSPPPLHTPRRRTSGDGAWVTPTSQWTSPPPRHTPRR